MRWSVGSDARCQCFPSITPINLFKKIERKKYVVNLMVKLPTHWSSATIYGPMSLLLLAFSVICTVISLLVIYCFTYIKLIQSKSTEDDLIIYEQRNDETPQRWRTAYISRARTFENELIWWLDDVQINATKIRAKIDKQGFRRWLLFWRWCVVVFISFLFSFSINILISVISFDVGPCQPLWSHFFSFFFV